MISVMSAESRANPRFAHEVDGEVRYGQQRIAVRTRDVSRGGLALSSKDSLPMGAEVQVVVALVFDEETFSEPLAMRARVVWCTKIGDVHQIGTTFIGMTAEQRHYLEMFLRYLREGQKRVDDAASAARPADEPDDPFG
jgi:hypothetical protein